VDDKIAVIVAITVISCWAMTVLINPVTIISSAISALAGLAVGKALK